MNNINGSKYIVEMVDYETRETVIGRDSYLMTYEDIDKIFN